MDITKLDEFPISPIQDHIYEIIPDKAKIVSSTNRLFNKYPTRYISAVPRFAITAYSNEGDTVLDPFCGSGTTAIEAMLSGRNAVSIDIDPFSRLLIKVKTTVYSPSDFELIESIVEQIRMMEPQTIDHYDLPDIPNINKWFCNTSICGLAFLLKCIDTLANHNDHVHNYLYVVVAAIIRKVSNADEVSPKPYVSSKYPKTPDNPITLFFKTESLYRDAIKDFSDRVRGLNCTSLILDSNDARTITSPPIDLAVTSPPYINAYDYVRSLRFEDIWLKLIDNDQLRENRKQYIGTETSSSFYKSFQYSSSSATLLPIMSEIEKTDKRRANIVGTYFEDMGINIAAVSHTLKQGGRYVIVVGNSNIRSQEIPTAKILSEIAAISGFTFDLSFKYVIRDRYLHLPRGNRGGIIKYDEVLVLKKK